MKYKIIGIELTPLRVPFKALVKQAMDEGGGLGMAIPAEEEWSGGEFVICKLNCDDGTFGIGEAFVWLPETGISPEQIIDAIKQALYKYVIGESPFNVERIRYKMDINVAKSDVAKGLLDMTCYDLMGKITGRPACDFMGGRCVEEIPLAALIPLADLETMLMLAKTFHKIGYRTFRYKLGNGIDDDLLISEKIREVLGSDVRLRVDYNQAYTPPKAVQAINAIEKFKIDLAEQPVRADDYMGMAYVQKRVNIPLMAHEGFFTLQDFITLVELEAVGVLGINSERPGGVTNALKALYYAKQRGLGAVLHNQPLGIASAMHIHFAAANIYSLDHPTELFGQVMMEDDLIVKRLDYSKGKAKVPDGSGWGVELDEKALEKYATSPTVIIGKSPK
ncbi:MAG: mandelate racemase/muconate lactonizing enzyme family protein [Candidatus Hodarchaeota archaeon]